MKNLLYLGIILMLGSCGSNELEKGSPVYAKYKREVSTVKIGNLAVLTEDLGEMDWDEAMKACADLGDGWRLPTKDELNFLFLYENKDKIGGFANGYYWSSTEDGSTSAWGQGFDYGSQDGYFGKFATNYGRAVRAF